VARRGCSSRKVNPPALGRWRPSSWRRPVQNSVGFFAAMAASCSVRGWRWLSGVCGRAQEATRIDRSKSLRSGLNFRQLNGPHQWVPRTPPGDAALSTGTRAKIGRRPGVLAMLLVSQLGRGRMTRSRLDARQSENSVSGVSVHSTRERPGSSDSAPRGCPDLGADLYPPISTTIRREDLRVGRDRHLMMARAFMAHPPISPGSGTDRALGTRQRPVAPVLRQLDSPRAMPVPVTLA